VSDFLGENYRDPERIAALFSYLDEMGREYLYDPDREVDGTSADALGVSPERIMAATLKIVEMDRGYISAEKAEAQQVLSTGDRVKGAFWSRNPNDAVRYEAGHLERAKEVVGWLKDQTNSDSLWMRNIAHLAGREAITFKNASLFASGYIAWNRELERKLRGERGIGDWIGQPGEKAVVAATLERQGGFETQFGYKSQWPGVEDDRPPRGNAGGRSVPRSSDHQGARGISRRQANRDHPGQARRIGVVQFWFDQGL
jgi:hypothetical protein